MKIFDCFPFFNELELLELRFMEYYKLVDHFVLVEATTSHTGKPKPLYFEENKARFKPYLDKVIHVIVDDLPHYESNEAHMWTAENFQRNCIQRGLNGVASEGDKIIVSDLDEFPDIRAIQQNLNNPSWVTFNQQLFYYYVNCRQNCHWFGSIMASYGSYSSHQELRNAARNGFNVLPGWGGWHYSFMGGAERVRKKVENIAESHYILNDVGTVEEIEQKMKTQVDLWNRTDDYAKKKILLPQEFHAYKPVSMDAFIRKYPYFYFEKLK